MGLGRKEQNKYDVFPIGFAVLLGTMAGLGSDEKHRLGLPQGVALPEQVQ
jgi:hypothetical protein